MAVGDTTLELGFLTSVELEFWIGKGQVAALNFSVRSVELPAIGSLDRKALRVFVPSEICGGS